MPKKITAADVLANARNCDWSDAAFAFRIVNNAGDGFDPEGDLGTLIGSEDGLSVYDDDGDAVIVDDDGAWAVRISADEPVTYDNR